ncbi:PALP protein [Rhizoctonia solani]|uniref:PALP protein n=1 Tax=Rhizoctonia solani TaxID=456999 RepID=A0A8H7M1I6_9AGAM|nr:PALP protein [Rhizoctonia solani]
MASGMIDDAIRNGQRGSRHVPLSGSKRWTVSGSSSACNLVACIKVAKELGRGKGKVVATILCDSGTRHYSKFWNDEYLEKAGIEVDVGIVEKMLKD